jgi:hypothetical protein
MDELNLQFEETEDGNFLLAVPELEIVVKATSKFGCLVGLVKCMPVAYGQQKQSMEDDLVHPQALSLWCTYQSMFAHK